jgi:hypothetical protein
MEPFFNIASTFFSNDSKWGIIEIPNFHVSELFAIKLFRASLTTPIAFNGERPFLAAS